MAGAFQKSAFQNSAFQTTGTIDGSFTADAVLLKTQSASFTADAFIATAVIASFTADAVVFKIVSGSFTLDAVVKRTGQPGSFTLDAVIKKAVSGSFTADAIKKKTIGPFVTSVTVTEIGGSLTGSRGSIRSHDGATNNYATARDGTGVVEAGGDYNLARQRQTGGNKYELTEGFMAWDTSAIPSGSVIVSVRLDAFGGITGLVYSGSAPTQNAEFRASTHAVPPVVGSWIPGGDLSNHTLLGTEPHTSFTSANTAFSVDLDVSAVTAGGTTKIVVHNERLRTNNAPTVDEAMIVWSTAQSVAQLGNNSQSPVLVIEYIAPSDQTFTANAVITGTRSGSFTADAIIKITTSGSFTADAVITQGFTGSFTLNAVIKKAISASFTANAVIKTISSASFTADAVISTGGFSGSFTLDAVINGTVNASFTVGAWIYSPRTGGFETQGGPGETPLVSIIVDGVDITEHVMLPETEFTMLVNGAIGTCNVRIRDDAHVLNFTGGSEITVDIDGRRRFGGYILSPKRLFAFPYANAADPSTVSRFITLVGVDYNILMTKRIVRDKSNPNNVELRHWPAGSHDDVVIRYVFDHYTDLAADGVTYHGVTHIGSPNPDKPGVIASGGLKFVDAMREINRLISGVFYIDAYKDLNYVDVDIPDAPYGLSDRPTGDQVGFREFSKTNNGANLVNDAMVWGAGQGSNRIKFSRVKSNTSIATHGLWQYGEFVTSMYRQASVDMRADTIVNGTPQSRRGRKDDQVSWRGITWDTGFEVGMKVPIESEVFGVSDVVPIRRLTVTFPTKRPMFDLTLSHEIDEPWNIFEFWFPKFGWDVDIDIDQPDPHDPGKCDCGITDSFTRQTSPDTLGTSDAGWPYFISGVENAVVNADGSTASIALDYSSSDHPQISAAIVPVAVPWNVTETKSIQFTLDNFGDPAIDFAEFLEISFRPFGGVLNGPRVIIIPSTSSLWLQGAGSTPGDPMVSQITWTSDVISGTTIPNSFFVAGTVYTFSVRTNGTGLIAAVTDGVDTYEIGISGVIGSSLRIIDRASFGFLRKRVAPYTTSVVTTANFDNLNIPEVTSCKYYFDDFDRSISNSWGYPWDPFGFTASHASVVSNTADHYGQMVVPAFDLDTITTETGGWQTASGFTFETTFLTSVVPSTGENVYYEVGDDDFDMIALAQISDDPDVGRVYLSSATIDQVAKVDWEDFTTYKMKIQYIPGDTCRLKLWKHEEEDEPTDWLLTVDANGVLTSTWSIIHGNQSSSSVTFRTFMVDFDYDGRPCCPPGLFLDNFSREEGFEWGTASSGFEWATGLDPGGDPDNAAEAFVTGGGGQIDLYSDVVGTDPDPPVGTIEIQGTTNAPWNAAHWIMQARVSASGRGIFGMIVERDDNTASRFWNIEADPTSAFANMIESTDTAIPDDHHLIPGGFDQVTFYIIKWEVEVGVYDRAKVWADPDNDGGIEPAEWIYNAEPFGAGIMFDVPSTFKVFLRHNGNNEFGFSDANLLLDYITFEAGCTDTSTRNPVSGDARDELTGDGYTTIFALPGTGYEIKSTRVFVNGYFQRPGIEYEETDPAAGIITFTTAPAAGSHISMFYSAVRIH